MIFKLIICRDKYLLFILNVLFNWFVNLKFPKVFTVVLSFLSYSHLKETLDLGPMLKIFNY
jgi:hypothetical protein